jgi:hypothetical protein
MPGLVGGYGNYLLPVQCGAPDMAKQKIKNIKFLIINSLIKNYSKINSKTLTNKELNLSYYLAGLIEGDGYISINNKNKVLIAITFNIKDKPLADKLLIILGLGKGFIVKRKTNSIELRFSSIISLKKIINLINGKFRTPKIEQLYKLIDWINKNHNTNFKKLPLDNSSLDNNSWLAGFIDADGCFYIRYSKKQIICKFNLEQRMIYPKTNESYKFILDQISLFLNVKLAIRNRLNYKNSYFIIKVENQNSIKILINYLTNNKLLSSKYLDFLEWNNAFKEILNKNHLLEEGKKKIYLYKNNMNNKRIYFNWDHLNFL